MNKQDLLARSMDDVLTEKELTDLLGMKKSALDDLRQKHKLPFCKISNTNRVYLVKDILDFIMTKRTILNNGSVIETHSFG